MKEFLIKYRLQIIISAIAITVLIGAVVAGLIRDRVGFSVVSGYQSTVRVSMTATQDTVPVSSLTLKDDTVLTMGALGSVVFLTVEPGKSKEEIIMCTDIATTTLAFTNCTRGLAFSGTSTISVSGNRKTHNAGSIVTLSNVHYVYEQLVDKDANETASGTKRFASNELIFGDGTTVGTKFFYGCDAVSTSTCGFIYFAASSTSPGAQDVGWSPDGVTTYSFNLGSAGLVAGKGISISNSIVTFNPAATSTSALGFSGSSPIIVNAPGQGLTIYSTGLGVATTSDFSWSGLHTWSATSTFATSTIASSTITWLNVTNTTTLQGGLVFQGRIANALVGGSSSNADALHTHDKLYNFVSSTATSITHTGTSETDILNTTLPANILKTRGYVRIKLFISDYDIANQGGAARSGTIIVYYGSTAIATCTLTTGTTASISNTQGYIEAYILGSGATNSQAGNCQMQVTTAVNTVPNSGEATYLSSSSGTATEDSTAAQTVRVTSDFSNADQGSITISHSIVEYVAER